MADDLHEYVYRCPVDGNSYCLTVKPEGEMFPTVTFQVRCRNCGGLHYIFEYVPAVGERVGNILLGREMDERRCSVESGGTREDVGG